MFKKHFHRLKAVHLRSTPFANGDDRHLVSKNDRMPIRAMSLNVRRDPSEAH